MRTARWSEPRRSEGRRSFCISSTRKRRGTGKPIGKECLCPACPVPTDSPRGKPTSFDSLRRCATSPPDGRRPPQPPAHARTRPVFHPRALLRVPAGRRMGRRLGDDHPARPSRALHAGACVPPLRSHHDARFPRRTDATDARSPTRCTRAPTASSPPPSSPRCSPTSARASSSRPSCTRTTTCARRALRGCTRWSSRTGTS